MKKIILSAIIALLPLTTMAATVLGFQVGGGSWKHAPSGSITSRVGGAGSSADLKDDLHLAEKSEGYTYAILEHPIPVIPNFKYVNTKLTTSGSGAVSTTFDFNGTNYSASTNVTSSLQLNQTDYIFYYELLDNVVSLDLGINAKKVDGKATVTGAADSTFSATVPMLYAAAEIMLPAGFAIAGEISTISAGKNEVSDVTAKLTYTTDFNLGVEAGIRNQTIKVDVDSVKTNIAFKGIFAGVYFKF